MSMTKTVIRKPSGAGNSPHKTTQAQEGAGPRVYKGTFKPKGKSALYKGKISPRRVQLRKVGSLGGGFSAAGMEKFIKPGLLVTAGALGFKTIDKLFLKKFLEENSATRNYPEEIKLALALVTGLSVAGFSKNNNVKLAALGVAVAQAVEYGSIKFVNALSTKATDPAKPGSGVGPSAGLRRVNPFAATGGFAGRAVPAPVSPKPAAFAEVAGGSNQFAV